MKLGYNSLPSREWRVNDFIAIWKKLEIESFCNKLVEIRDACLIL